MKLNDNLIEYTNIPNSKPTNTASVAGTIFDAKNKYWELEEGDTPSKLVNAVEIDWNGAVINGQTINSTGELLQERIQQNSPMFARVA